MAATHLMLGIGSNCGDRADYIRRAIRYLRADQMRSLIKVNAVSSVYESNAMLPPSAPLDWNKPFLNIAVLCETSSPAPILLERLKTIEKLIGRQVKQERWAPREIDIDILALGSEVINEPGISIPHPGLCERPFALMPFAELLSLWRYPREGPNYGKTAKELSQKWAKPWVSKLVPFATRLSSEVLSEAVGILNITPDSFSDGGQFMNLGGAIDHADALVMAGAKVLDIGAESTRPGARPVDPNNEWQRLLPVIKALLAKKQEWRDKFGFVPKLSIDTRNARVAAMAIEAGVDWINDVSGCGDQEMIRAVAKSEVDLVVMHSLGVPPDKVVVISDAEDPIEQLLSWGERRIGELIENGIGRPRIIFDPGIGFGKTIEQNIYILRSVGRLHELGVRLLVGHSRKSFMQRWLDLPADRRDIETAAIAYGLAGQGVDYLRVHNVEMMMRVLRAGAMCCESYGLSRNY